MIKRKNKVIGVLMLMAVLLFVPMSGIIGEILEDANITLVAKAKVIEGDFEFEVFENEKRATLTKYNGTASVVTIPDKVGDANVTAIDIYAFYENTNLVSVNLPKELISLDGFKKCINLKSVDIPGKVMVISSYAFSGCSSLESVTIPEIAPNKNMNIQDGAFNGCTSLKTITLPKNVTTIQSNTFKDCTSLSKVILKEGLLGIFKNAFDGCTSLTSITIPNSVCMIEDGAFNNCGTPFTIVGKPGSVAEEYANKNSYLFSKEDNKTETTDNQENSVSDNKTTFNIKNKKTYKNNKKITIKDADGLNTVKLNSKKISVKKGTNILSFKLSKYKKTLKKKGKLNKLVVVDVNNNKATIQFKTK